MTQDIHRPRAIALIIGAALLICFVVFASSFDYGTQGDDFWYFVPPKYPAFNYFEYAQGRYFQPLANKFVFDLVGPSQISVHIAFFVLWLLGAIPLFGGLRRSFSLEAAVLGTLFFLCYSGKYEVIGWAAAGLYTIVLGAATMSIWIVQVRSIPFSLRMVAVSLLYWVAMHLYEVLLPLAGLPVLWVLAEAYRTRRPVDWSRFAAALLPVAVSLIHLLILATSPNPIWNRSGDFGIGGLLAAIPETVALSLDQAFGSRHFYLLSQTLSVDQYAFTLWTETRFLYSVLGLLIVAGAIAILLVLRRPVVVASRNSQSADATPRFGERLYWIVAGLWIVAISPAIDMPETIGDWVVPSRLTYLPSLGAAILIACLIDWTRSRLVTVLVLALCVVEAISLQSLFYQYVKATQYDNDLREQLRSFSLPLKYRDRITLITPYTEYMHRNFPTIPSQMDRWPGVLLILIDNQAVLKGQDSWRPYESLTYAVVRPGDPIPDSDYIFRRRDDGSICRVEGNACVGPDGS